MTAKQKVETEGLRMREAEFDAVMRKALQVKPKDGKPKSRAKAKAKAKKRPRQ